MGVSKSGSTAPPAGRLRQLAPVLAKALGLLGSVALFAWVLSHADAHETLTRLRAVGPLALLLLLPFPLALLLDTTAWRTLLGRLRLPSSRPSLARMFRVRLATEAVSNALPAGVVLAEALGPLLLARDAAPAATFTSSAAKRWLIVRTHGYYVGLAALVGFGALAMRSQALVSSAALPWMVIGTAAALLVLSLVVQRAARAGLAVRAYAGLDALSRSRLFRWIAPPPREAFASADGHLETLAKQRHPRAASLIFGAWMFESIETFLALKLLGAPVSFVDVLAFDAALSVVRTVAVLSPLGLGVQDLGYLAFLQAFGVPTAVGPAFLVLKRTKEFVFIGLGLSTLAWIWRGGARREAAA